MTHRVSHSGEEKCDTAAQIDRETWHFKSAGTKTQQFVKSVAVCRFRPTKKPATSFPVAGC
jgi:hypothetical protein